MTRALLIAAMLLSSSCARQPGPPRESGAPAPSSQLQKAAAPANTAQDSIHRDPARIAHSYYALLAEGRYGEARQLWTQGGEGSGMSAEAFAASFAPYASYQGTVGKAGPIEGAAGSLFVTLPVRIDARMKSGADVHRVGEVILRRVNDVPGSTPEQRTWHIFQIDLNAPQ